MIVPLPVVLCTGSRYGDILIAAEREAKEAKRGLWESYVEVKAADERAERGDELVNMRVCEVQDGAHFYAHTSVDEAKVCICICRYVYTVCMHCIYACMFLGARACVWLVVRVDSSSVGTNWPDFRVV